MELRKILFDLGEVERAVAAYCRAQGRSLVDGDIAAVSIGEDPAATVSIALRPADASAAAPEPIVLRRDDVTEALIQYAIRQHIPLPKAGKKVLWPQEDGIAMLVTLVSAVDPAKADAKEKDAFAGAASLQRLIRRDG
jgi:hypothetical protein